MSINVSLSLNSIFLQRASFSVDNKLRIVGFNKHRMYTSPFTYAREAKRIRSVGLLSGWLPGSLAVGEIIAYTLHALVNSPPSDKRENST